MGSTLATWAAAFALALAWLAGAAYLDQDSVMSRAQAEREYRQQLCGAENAGVRTTDAGDVCTTKRGYSGRPARGTSQP